MATETGSRILSESSDIAREPVPSERNAGASTTDTNVKSGDAGLVEHAQRQAGAIWDDVKKTTRSVAARQQHNTAASIGDFAAVLRNAAMQLDGQEQTTVSRFASHAADGLENFAGKLRNQDLNGIVRGVESFAREQPAAFLGAAFAAGFLAIRFLRSSSEPDSRLGSDRHHPLDSGGPADPRQFH
jgi:hypothetical protein